MNFNKKSFEDMDKYDWDKFFVDMSVEFCYALGLRGDLDRLCRAINYGVKTENIDLIHRGVRTLRYCS